jgi:predicted RNase H-like HicB family nuclease/uncharacterized damage-inducible protein DinB
MLGVYLQVKRTGRTHAHVPDLPGCNWVTNSPEEAICQAEASIRRHLDWLKKYGQMAPAAHETIQLYLAQQHKSTAREGDLVGFFESDRQPVQWAEIPGFLELMQYARMELLSLTREIPPEVLEWRPESKEWTITEVLRHVAGAQRYYLTRLYDTAGIPIQQPSRSVWTRLERMQALSLAKLAEFSEEQLEVVVTDSSGELWSARKVFRRYIEHEREHTQHIQQIFEQYQIKEK